MNKDSNCIITYQNNMEIVVIESSNENNIMSESYNNSDNKIVILLYNMGYIFFYRKGNKYTFIKQDKLDKYYTPFEEIGLKKEGCVYYRYENNPSKVSKIIFAFTPFPLHTSIYSESLFLRYFVNSYKNLFQVV